MRDAAVTTYVAGALERIRRHPFIIAADAQTLTREQATRWVFCAGRESRSFPHILENLVARSTQPRLRALLQANLDDEYGNGNPDDAHPSPQGTLRVAEAKKASDLLFPSLGHFELIRSPSQEREHIGQSL